MALLHLALGLAGLLFGSELAVRGSIRLAMRWHWPAWLTGVLLLAVGTSLPELFVSGSAARAHPLLASGNVTGSNAFNVGAVLGILLLMRMREGLPAAAVRSPALPPLLVGTALSFLLLTDAVPWALTGSLLLGCLVWMLVASLRGGAADSAAALEGEAGSDEARAERAAVPVGANLALAAAGFACLAIGSQFFLGGALDLAEEFGWSEGFAGYLITAVGTSAPELFTSIRAVRHGHADAVVGNVVGSNSFNLLGVGGTVGILAGSTPAASALLPQLLANGAFNLVLLAPLLHGRRTERGDPLLRGGWGPFLLAGYLYTAWTVSTL